MQATPYPDVNALLDVLLSNIKAILGEKLVGLYIYGSLVWGDFDPDISDIDLLAAITEDISDEEAAALEQMHADFAPKHSKWDNRIEVKYFSLAGLKTFRTQTTRMAVISPGEPFHVIEAGKERLMNWYFVQEKGLTLFGPPPATIIDPISKEEFIRAAADHARQWREWIEDAVNSRPSQSYAILTICRALYASRYGEQVSKKQAALWAAEEFPEWAGLIQNALVWRREAVEGKEVDGAATFPEARRFVYFITEQI